MARVTRNRFCMQHSSAGTRGAVQFDSGADWGESAGGEDNLMKNGWSIAVSSQTRTGTPVTRHYLVAIESEQLAREAVERIIDSNEIILAATKIEPRHLTHRNMAANEVFELGRR